jgi:hypothetical protein
MFTTPCLFAEVNWGQGFVYGLIGGGILLAIFGLIQIFRAMQVEYKEREQVEQNQPLLIGYIVLGLVMIGGGIVMKDQVGGLGGGGGGVKLADFIEYTSKEGRFRAKFPKQPKEQTQGYLSLKFKMFNVEEKDGIYAVAYFDIPDLKPSARMQATMLDNARNGMMYMMNAKLKGKPARIALEGRYPGQEFAAECKDKNVEMFCSIYLVDNRAYQVLIMGKHDWLQSDKARKFLNSFALR